MALDGLVISNLAWELSCALTGGRFPGLLAPLCKGGCHGVSRDWGIVKTGRVPPLPSVGAGALSRPYACFSATPPAMRRPLLDKGGCREAAGGSNPIRRRPHIPSSFRGGFAAVGIRNSLFAVCGLFRPCGKDFFGHF